MTSNRNWHNISPEESVVVTAIVDAAGLPEGQAIIADLDGAVVAPETDWILDIRAAHTAAPGADLPDGPFPARAFVPNEAAYQGEVIIWVKNGHITGLEYAWITDEPPTDSPRPDELEVVAQPGR